LSASIEQVISTAKALCPTHEAILELTARGAPRWFARSGPRYFVPMSNWRTRLSSSKICPAFNRKARFYRMVLRAWVTLDGARLTHQVSFERGEDWVLGDLLRSHLPTLSTAAVSIGIQGPGQKITIQLMDGSGRILGFAKYADKPYTRSLAANEARMLERIPKGVGPRLVGFMPFLEGDLLVQTALPGRPYRPRLRLDAAQLRFFERLVIPGKVYAASEHPFVKSLYTQSGERRGLFEEILKGFGNSEWPVAWTHGDMAPWNMRRWRGNCLAFDWEHGREVGFAYLDAAANLIQVASIIRRADPREGKRAVSDELKARLPAQHAKFAPAIAALSALSMLVSWYPPRLPDAYEVWLERFIEASF